MARRSHSEFNTAGFARPSATHLSPQQAITNLSVRLPILERALEAGFNTKADEQIEAMYPALVRLALMCEKRIKSRLINGLIDAGDGPVMVESSTEDKLIIDGIFDTKELAKRFVW